MKSPSRRIAWTSAVIHGLVHASVLLLPAVFGDLQRAFGVSFLAILAAANAMYFVFGIAALPAGLLADRIGSRRMLVVSAGGSGAALLLLSQATTFPLFAAGLVLLGLFAGIYHPSGLSLLSRGVESKERGRAIGIHGVGGTLGEALAPVFAAAIARAFGWRYGFVAAAFLALAAALLAGTLPLPARAAGPRPVPASFAATTRALGRTLLGFWRSRPLRFLLLSMIAGGFVYRGVLTFLPQLLPDSQGGALQASSLTSAVLVAGILAQRFGGELADRLPRERLFLAEVALYVPVLVLLGVTSGVGLVALALCFGFLWYASQPLANALTAAYADSNDHGLVFGLQFAVTFGVGSFATTLGGLLHARGGATLAFIGFGVVAILQLAAACALVQCARGEQAVAAPPAPGRA